MARKVQRNDPCPCGSGKKYKQCCLAKDSGAGASRSNRRRGVQIALGWINRAHEVEISNWVDKVWLKDLSPQQRQGISTAHPGIRSIHDVNLLEELVAEGKFDEIEGENSALKLILNADLGLDDEQKSYLSQLAERPLRLYRVSDVQTNKSFTIERHPDAGSEPITIEDSSASSIFDIDDIVGLRLMQSGDSWETSGSAYHIPIDYVDDLLTRLENAGEDEYSKTLVHYWLELVARHV
ncbi:SEC-C motif-containing protein [Mariprofundus ferrinatatus]|uniref:SEC-C motif-containing protein n=1 Tax=Mariprofundus ferrinatatus TaxID=1921087 RepID=A0A2K8LC92_9PROT|nr:SEC-C metal-binding domain-containing protein [Mariprofundus ferrinatatus]ATX82514.1 SEC-C motif-containing protein [Mariprofundus ferrinatatus]